MAVAVTDTEEVEMSARVSFISPHSHVSGRDHGPYLSMLLSHVSPTRSSSESCCQWTKRSVGRSHSSRNISPSIGKTAPSYLVGVGHFRAAVTGVSHAIAVSVSLVYVGDSRAVVEKVRLACEEKNL